MNDVLLKSVALKLSYNKQYNQFSLICVSQTMPPWVLEFKGIGPGNLNYGVLIQSLSAYCCIH